MVPKHLRIRIRQEHHDVLDAMLGEVADDIIDEGLSPDRYHSFGDVAG